jgi:cytochrome c oxidase subunit 2
MSLRLSNRSFYSRPEPACAWFRLRQSNMKGLKAGLACFATLATAALLGACNPAQFPASTFAPRSDLAHWVQSVYFETIAWDSLILALICVLVFLLLTRYSTRAREDQPGPPPPHSESLELEIAWTAGPALILLFIAVPSLRIVFRSQPMTPPPNSLIINVTAHQWWWQFDYPGMGIETANEVHVPAGRPVRFLLRSADVIHSFWLPAMGGKRDVIPGHVNELTFTPDTPGEYIGECAEFCGLSHANMRFRLFVQTPVAFDDWRANQAAGPLTATKGAAQEGQEVFMTSACTTCHTIKGYSSGYIGPNLTHFASRSTFAGGTISNTPANVTAWIEDPEALKPGAQMPPLGLRGKELDQLVAYLESLK